LRVVGIDLAWMDTTVANETGVVALEPDGTILAAGWTTGVEETVAWVNSHATDDTILFVDAPLVVLNPGKQRVCEKRVGQRYDRWKVSANSTNLASPRLAGVRFRLELEASGWTYSDGVGSPPRTGHVVSECYPYTTLVGAHEFGYELERPLYKRKPRRLPMAEWRAVRAESCDVLIQRLAGLRGASPPLDLRSHPTTEQLLNEPSPLNDRAYKHLSLIGSCDSRQPGGKVAQTRRDNPVVAAPLLRLLLGWGRRSCGFDLVFGPCAHLLHQRESCRSIESRWLLSLVAKLDSPGGEHISLREDLRSFNFVLFDHAD
jgi:predicted RNase H-like nuclease